MLQRREKLSKLERRFKESMRARQLPHALRQEFTAAAAVTATTVNSVPATAAMSTVAFPPTPKTTTTMTTEPTTISLEAILTSLLQKQQAQPQPQQKQNTAAQSLSTLQEQLAASSQQQQQQQQMDHENTLLQALAGNEQNRQVLLKALANQRSSSTPAATARIASNGSLPNNQQQQQQQQDQGSKFLQELLLSKQKQQTSTAVAAAANVNLSPAAAAAINKSIALSNMLKATPSTSSSGNGGTSSHSSRMAELVALASSRKAAAPSVEPLSTASTIPAEVLAAFHFNRRQSQNIAQSFATHATKNSQTPTTEELLAQVGLLKRSTKTAGMQPNVVTPTTVNQLSLQQHLMTGVEQQKPSQLSNNIEFLLQASSQRDMLSTAGLLAKMAAPKVAASSSNGSDTSSLSSGNSVTRSTKDAFIGSMVKASREANKRRLELNGFVATGPVSKIKKTF